ncbi:MAG: hypothetical protein WD512_00805, partial [Candidatus Paceibacterota bacterium]
MINYLNILGDAIGESQFGIILNDATEFCDFLKTHPEIQFTTASEHEHEHGNLWECKVNNNSIKGVCCTEKWVIVPNSKRKKRIQSEQNDRYSKYEYIWKAKHI